MRTIKKELRQYFVDAVYFLLEDIGANHITKEYDTDKYELETQCGKLMLSLRGELDHVHILSLYAKFEEPERAKKHVVCNPYSGKWNFHGPIYNAGNKGEVKGFVEYIKKELEKIK